MRLITLLLMAWACLAPALAARGPLVLAAVSLQDALNAAADSYAAKGSVRPVLSFAGTATIARQVIAGAPADLFISADDQWMDALEGQALTIAGSRALLASNRLVLVAPASRPFRLALKPGAPLAARLGGGRLAMADPEAVPAGRYGKAALISLGLWQGVEGRLVRAENVRAALALVERGETAAGIVYATDAQATRRVRIAGIFPEASHPPIHYWLATLKTVRHPEAERFRRYLLSAEGRAILRRFGFTAARR